MAETKYSTLQRQIAEGKDREEKLKDRVSTWRSRAIEERKRLKSSIIQYERVIKEWRKMYNDLLDSGWKLLFVKVKNWYDKKRGIKNPFIDQK